MLVWPLKELAELADGPAGCGELARGGCLFASNFSATRSIVIYNFRRVLNAVLCLLGNLPASKRLVPTLRNLLSVPSS